MQAALREDESKQKFEILEENISTELEDVNEEYEDYRSDYNDEFASGSPEKIHIFEDEEKSLFYS